MIFLCAHGSRAKNIKKNIANLCYYFTQEIEKLACKLIFNAILVFIKDFLMSFLYHR